MNSKLSFKDLLEEGLSLSSLPPLSTEVLDKLDRFYYFLEKWNKKINLTAHSGLREAVELNFIDSLHLVSQISSPTSVLDIGSGAGFPALIIKMIYESLSMTLVEADQRKSSFLFHAFRELGLEKVRLVNEFLTQKNIQSYLGLEIFSHIVSRATFSPGELVKLLRPLLTKNVALFFMLSRKQFAEFQKDKSSWSIIAEKKYLLPFSMQERIILGLKMRN